MALDKGEDGTCPTVRIVAPVTNDNPDGYIVINDSDFDPEQHELADSKVAGASEPGSKKAKHGKAAGASEK